MGTNYYLLTNYCTHCKRGDEVHLGKSSFGWTFTYKGSDKIRSRSDWINYISEEIKKGAIIQNEYGTIITPEEMILVADSKKYEIHNHAREYPEGSWFDDEGNSFSGYEFS